MLPPEVRQLLWDVDPAAMDLVLHEPLILERVMTRGSLSAMRWLIATLGPERLRNFVQGPGGRALAPREVAFWFTVLGLDVPPSGRQAGGGRPAWAG